MKRWMLTAVMMAAATGCQRDVAPSLWEQIRTLSEEKTGLTLEVEQLRRENAALSGQVETLAALDAPARTAAMVIPETLRIGRHTGFYDKTRDARPDRFIVYLEPLDAQQDVIKAAGSVEVELWDLSAAPEQAQCGRWHVNAEDLKTLWGRGLLGAYYRLTFPLDGTLDGTGDELTVRVRFTDYLSGKVLTDQRVISR